MSTNTLSPPLPTGAAETATSTLLDAPVTARHAGRQLVAGLALSSLYGLALGAREGGVAMMQHGLGVPAALVGVALLGLPALYVVLALLDAPIDAASAARAAVRSIGAAGLALGGLAPLAALYVLGSEATEPAAIAGGLGLGLGGLLGLARLHAGLFAPLARASTGTRFLGTLTLVGFSVFAVAVAVRIWAATLPIFGGLS